jgi:peptide/nickel transport system substrate-binding protein
VLALLAGCGGASPRAHRATPHVKLLMASAPDSLDPAVGYDGQALEADWLAYTPLLTYFHSNGVGGTQVIAGLATDLPLIGDYGRTYTFTLRPGLVYSDGEPVKASDFTWAVKRAIKLRWPGASPYLEGHIVGAAAFAAGRSKTISGIITDDTSGTVRISLTAPYGQFENVLALPATAPVPSSTPMRNEQTSPPPGVGPYEIAKVVLGRSFSLIKNPRWRPNRIPGIPSGRVDTDVAITDDEAGNALAVLHNAADVLDPFANIPARLLPLLEAQAGKRYQKEAVNGSYMIFMNVDREPFSSQLARQGVQMGLDDDLLKLIGSGALQEGCFLIPPSMYGHPHYQCPQGNIFAGGSLSGARALVRQSGTAGTRVTVWTENGSPVRGWMAYYATLLDRLGFRASLRVVPDARYYATIGRLALHPQTGFGEAPPGLPNPADLFQWLTGPAIRPTGNRNWGEVDDPYINAQVRTLAPVPAANLTAVSAFWQELDRYAAQRAYGVVFGYLTAPGLVSDRIERRALVFSPVAGYDWSSFQLK